MSAQYGLQQHFSETIAYDGKMQPAWNQLELADAMENDDTPANTVQFYSSVGAMCNVSNKPKVAQSAIPVVIISIVTKLVQKQ